MTTPRVAGDGAAPIGAVGASTGRQRLKGLLRSWVPLRARKGLAVWIGRRRWPASRYWLVLELLRDYAARDPDGFHRFLWSHHLAYAETYEVAERFGAERVHPTRRMLFDDLRRCLEGRGLDPTRDVRSVLEVGCSLGYLLRHLETEVFPSAVVLDGLDIDEYAVRVGEAHLRGLGSRVRLRVGDVAGLAAVAAPIRYDVTICAGVLLYLRQDEAARVVAATLRHTGGVAAFAGLAHPERDNADLAHSAVRDRDATFIHNIDAMVQAAGARVLFRRWEGVREVEGNTIYFVLASPPA